MTYAEQKGGIRRSAFHINKKDLERGLGMHRNNSFFILMSLVILVSLLSGCGSNGSSGTVSSAGGTGTDLNAIYKVTGTITEIDGQTPVKNATCSISEKSADNQSATTTTDEQGNYSFSSLPYGEYILRVTENNHINTNFVFKVNSDTVNNGSILHKDKWAGLMGADHPLSTDQGCILVKIVQGSARGGEVGVQNVDVDQFPAEFTDVGYVNGSSVDWADSDTNAEGTGVFYNVTPGDNYSICGSKSGVNVSSITGVKAVAGEITMCTLKATDASGDISAPIQRVINMRPIKGMCYAPNPDSFSPGAKPWPDADFYNEDFKAMWGASASPSRDDLGNMKTLGVKFLHLYDWSRQGTEGYWNGKRDHTSFFQYVEDKQFKMAYPISAWFVGRAFGSLPEDSYQFDESAMSGFIKDLVNDVYPGGNHRNCVTMIALGNEYDLGQQSQNAKKTASIIQKILTAENDLGISDDEKVAITAPVSTATKPTWYTGDAEEECKIALRELRKELKALGLDDVWKKRFVVSINPFQNATGLTTRIKTQYPNMLKSINDGEDMYFCFFESGWPEYGDENAQAAMYDEQLAVAMPLAADSSSHFLGLCVLEMVNVKNKGNPDGTHGVYKVSSAGGMGKGTTTGNETYDLDKWEKKANYDSVLKNFQP